MTEVYIKNMVCPRCIAAVRQIFEDRELIIEDISLGYVRVGGLLDSSLAAEVNQSLKAQGFELIDSGKNRLVEAIKTLVISTIFHQEDGLRGCNWSATIAESLSHDYNYLSTLFSATEGVTIEQFIIKQKTERVKELLCYNELSLKEIAFSLGYSSAAHLSTQFKRVTSHTPGQFKAMQHKRDNRIPLDAV